jgi:hypothetical protein
MQALIPCNLKGPRSKALEPDCLFPSTFNYDTVSAGRGEGEGGIPLAIMKFNTFVLVFRNSYYDTFHVAR